MGPWAGHGGGGGDVGFVVGGEEEVGAVITSDHARVVDKTIDVASYGFRGGERTLEYRCCCCEGRQE